MTSKQRPVSDLAGNPDLKEGSQSTWSRLAVEQVGGRSRLTTCLSLPPLKILSPKAGGDYGVAILSSYGGGLVSGDCARLQVHCGPEAKLFLGTQAFTKVYKALDGQIARQQIDGRIGPGGCTVVLPDPVVPYADSVFLQEQTWTLEKDALLILLDSGTAGRGERGERFDYSAYTSRITVWQAQKPLLVERFDSCPALHPGPCTGSFGPYAAFANAFILGPPNSVAFNAIESILRRTLAPQLAAQLAKHSSPAQSLLVSLVQTRPGVLALRALGDRSRDLAPVLDALASAVADAAVLGANPLRRKY
ncbi:MAG: hypothetical protein GKR89_14740 [Candidatus Latescibacteria bacterium]|nr:hypothetical protein [Candidatus Latescibacterota bacterium]